MYKKHLLFLSILNMVFLSFKIHCCEIKIENEENLFMEFINKFKITYRTEKERQDKQTNFEQNLSKIKMRNCLPDYECKRGGNQSRREPFTYELGINKFFDLSQEELEENFHKLIMDENTYSYKYFKAINSDDNEIPNQKLFSKFTNRFINALSKFNIFSTSNSNENDDSSSNSIKIEYKNTDNKTELENKSEDKINKIFNSNLKNKNYNNYEVLFDWRDNHIFNEIDPFSDKAEKEVGKKKNKESLTDNYPDHFAQMPANKLEDFKLNYNPFKLADFHEDILWEMSYSETNVNNYKKFYSYLKYKSNKDLEFVLKNIGPVYIQVKGSGIETYMNGIFNPHSCEYKYKLGSFGAFLVGYGKEDGVEFWIAKSTFGVDWGEDSGYFKILKSEDEDVFDFRRFVFALKIFEI